MKTIINLSISIINWKDEDPACRVPFWLKNGQRSGYQEKKMLVKDVAVENPWNFHQNYTLHICKSCGIIQFHFTKFVTLVCKILCTAR